MNLEELGYTSELEEFRINNDLSSFEVGRVIAEHRDRFDVISESGVLDCEVTGNLRFTSESREDLPAVGDWVSYMEYDDKGLIHSVLPRKSIIKRKVAGRSSDVQVIATNIDYALIVQAVDRDFNLNRLERYLVICNTSNLIPIVILNKVDLVESEQREEMLSEVKKRIGEVSIVEVSNQLADGFDQLRPLIKKGQTYCLLGSSGVGKSTITNELANSGVMQTGEISESVGKGSHTTTHREIILLPSGALIIDNPGMREVGISDAEGGLETTFASISDLAQNCRYSDCTHTNESDCAVLNALDSEELDPDTYNSFLKLQKEREHFEATTVEKRRKDKSLGKLIKNHQKLKNKNNR
ncbi:MAG: ribosome small subunit-dependent GTPase A [Cyclobacteriaceae bacterium]